MFERANGAEVKRMIRERTVRLGRYPMAFLDDASDGTRHSTRAANAIATVADRAPDALLAFHRLLFEQQPAENTPGLPDERFASLTRDADVPQAVVERIFEPWVTVSKVTGTPTVKIDGRVFKGNLNSVGPLTSAVESAREGK
jgi:protein-disulfide isomerase